MSSSSLYLKTASELRAGYLAREFSAVEVAQSYLERIQETNTQLNSFISVAGEEMIAAAKRADETLRDKGEGSALLTGIPVAVKDCLATKNFPTTCASRMLLEYRSPFDATAVSRLEEQGALISGKTNLDEFAMGSSTEFSYFGVVKNPWDLSRVAGGTSGGSAAAVSAAQSPIALGTDTGGSIRQPASFCGVIGLKPTYGRVSRYGLVAHASSFDQIGAFSRSIEDLALVLQSIAGVDSRDSTSSSEPVAHYAAKLNRFDNGFKGLRVGIPKEYFGEGISAEVKTQIHAALERFTSLGAELVEVSLPHTKYALATYYIITPAEASSNLSRYDGVHYGYRSPNAKTLDELYSKSRSEGFGPEVKRRILIGTFVLSTGYYDAFYRKAQQVRTLLIDDFRAVFANDCDVLLTPTTPTTAFNIGEHSRSPLEMYQADICTVPASIAGLPSISLPCGTDSSGLPIGMQLMAAPFKEELLLAIGQRCTAEFPVTIPPAWSS